MLLLSFISQDSDSEGVNEREFRQIFDAHFEDLRRFLYYKSKNKELAEDMAQDAFVKLWEKRAEIRISTVKTLLFTIGNNLMLNTFKKDQHHLSFVKQEVFRHENENPEFILEKKEFQEHLENVINTMPDGSREVFIMNRVDGLKYAEIASALGISVKAVEKRMSKALKIMREKISRNI